MIPMQWHANVKLPYYGWFGETFSSEADARRFVAKMLKSGRRDTRVTRPSYSGRCYWIKPRLLSLDDC